MYFTTRLGCDPIVNNNYGILQVVVTGVGSERMLRIGQQFTKCSVSGCQQICFDWL